MTGRRSNEDRWSSRAPYSLKDIRLRRCSDPGGLTAIFHRCPSVGLADRITGRPGSYRPSIRATVTRHPAPAAEIRRMVGAISVTRTAVRKHQSFTDHQRRQDCLHKRRYGPTNVRYRTRIYGLCCSSHWKRS